MTQTADLLGVKSTSHFRLVGVVSAAHFISHYYILLLAPLLPFVRAEYGVSYTEIGLALAAFNIVTAALQTPAGFLVDRLGARILLIVGLVVGASAFVVAGLVDSFWIMVAMFALAGVGNAVYHPADYALLSHRVPADRIGQAFSVHTFAGMLGSAAGAGKSADDAKPMGLARRLHRRGHPRLCGCGGLAHASRRCAGQTSASACNKRQIPGRVAAAAVGADPAQSHVLCAARPDEWRHVQLFGGGAWRALWHAGHHRQCGVVVASPVGRDRRAGWRNGRHTYNATRL